MAGLVVCGCFVGLVVRRGVVAGLIVGGRAIGGLVAGRGVVRGLVFRGCVIGGYVVGVIGRVV